MEPALVDVIPDFIRALRSAGASVSPAEAIDAARALAVVGYADRALMKDSFAIVLAKSEQDKAVHDELFELFFSRQAASQGSASDRGTDTTDTNINTNQRALDIEQAAKTVGVDDIRFSTQKAYYTQRLLEEMGQNQRDAKIAQRLQDPSPQAQQEAQALLEARAELRRQARQHVDQRFELFGQGATDAFMADVMQHRPMAQLARSDLARMRTLVAHMARRLAVRHARRQRQTQRGRLDLRRTLRANAGHDGVPVDLVWKYQHKERPKIVAVCDVSGSVLAHVQFLLLFLHALKDEVTDLEAFAFSAQLKDVGHLLQDLPFEQAMAQIVGQLGSGSTDYGQALLDLNEHHPEVIDRRTTVLILGDARSNRTDPRLDLFRGLVARAKRVVWLCPEVPGRWGTGDSCMLQYQPHCSHVAHCASLSDLEREIDDMLLAYD